MADDDPIEMDLIEGKFRHVRSQPEFVEQGGLIIRIALGIAFAVIIRLVFFTPHH